MDRRKLLQSGLGFCLARPLIAAAREEEWEAAGGILEEATARGRVHAAALHVQRGERIFARVYGAATSRHDSFLLASITKPMSVAALMTLHDERAFQLDDPVKKFIPEFHEGPRATITVRQLLTHVSGLPDQLPENHALRERHAEMSEFVAGAIRAPLSFAPGSRYGYSSMGILLASEVARRISGQPFHAFIDEAVFQPLGMKHSALGLGRFSLDQTMRCQVEHAAPESGSGDSTARSWDWNSLYWRRFGAPWGGGHGSAGDVARFFAEFLHPTGSVLKPETARLMLGNHNRPGITPRGLGFSLGPAAGSPGCSDQTFGHGGSTGTLAWADPRTNTICVVLTTLPARALTPHPRTLVSDRVAAGMA